MCGLAPLDSLLVVLALPKDRDEEEDRHGALIERRLEQLLMALAPTLGSTWLYAATNIVTFLDKLTEMIDRGKPADIFYLDIAKAFDKGTTCKASTKAEIKGHR